MKFQFTPLTVQLLKEIASWDYNGFDEKVSMDAYFVSLRKTKTLTGPGGCDGYAALMDNKTVGLFEFKKQESTLEIGLALKPTLIGKGLGVEYARQGIEFGVRHYDSNLAFITLTVNSKNAAAIRVYEKIGFVSVDGVDDELKMIMPVKGDL